MVSMLVAISITQKLQIFFQIRNIFIKLEILPKMKSPVYLVLLLYTLLVIYGRNISVLLVT